MTVTVAASGDYPARVNLLVADVFSNLLGNAIKYGRAGTEVWAGVEDGGDVWRVRVANLGDPIRTSPRMPSSGASVVWPEAA